LGRLGLANRQRNDELQDFLIGTICGSRAPVVTNWWRTFREGQGTYQGAARKVDQPEIARVLEGEGAGRYLRRRTARNPFIYANLSFIALVDGNERLDLLAVVAPIVLSA